MCTHYSAVGVSCTPAHSNAELDCTWTSLQPEAPLARLRVPAHKLVDKVCAHDP